MVPFQVSWCQKVGISKVKTQSMCSKAIILFQVSWCQRMGISKVKTQS